MSERVVKIKLEADASGAVSGFAAVRDAAAEAKQKIGDSARSNREEWATVGAGLTAVGVAVTGLGVAALHTGIQYNTLQQTTRAALTTLLGSATAANAQMDKLDDFARNSPFAKQTFIEAQQQMLAFGIETQKVLPYLDSVQNAVAAMGGSNQQISEIAFIMSQISSASKITGTDLMQLGQRGINAADLIGSQMGKTGAEIREEITAGTLDADKALDALAAGMSQKFGGAADNVKNTFAGAMDRVKAAWRDFASELARPLVDPNGGGALVDLLNWTADAMRNFEKLPEPVKNTVSALTGLVGVGALVTGTAMLAIPKWLQFTDALASLGVTSGGAKNGLKGLLQFLGGPWGIALMAATASINAFNVMMEDSKATSEELSIGLKQGADGFAVMRAESEKGMQLGWIYDLTSSLDDLGNVLEENANYANGFTKFWTQDFDDRAAIENVKEFGDVLSNIASNDMPRAQSEFKAFGEAADLTREQLALALDEMPAFKDALLGAADASGLATDDATLLKIALGELEVTGPVSGLEELAGVANRVTEDVSKLADEIKNFGSAQFDVESTSIKLQDAFRGLQEQLDGGSASLDKTTEAGSKTHKQLLEVAKAANDNAAAIAAVGGETEEILEPLEAGRQRIIDTRLALDDSQASAEAYADSLIATPDAVRTQVEENAKQAQGNVDSYKGAVNTIPETKETTVIAHTSEAKSAFQSIVDTVNSIKTVVDVTVRQSVERISGKAHGGTIGFAQGGTIPGHANGATVGGFGGGVSQGTVWGAGTGKSDSVLVRLSPGEEVIQEPYASANRGLLKALNRGAVVNPMPMAAVSQPQAAVQNVYVQNPFTGEYLIAKQMQVAERAVDDYDSEIRAASRRAGA